MISRLTCGELSWLDCSQRHYNVELSNVSMLLRQSAERVEGFPLMMISSRKAVLILISTATQCNGDVNSCRLAASIIIQLFNLSYSDHAPQDPCDSSWMK